MDPIRSAETAIAGMRQTLSNLQVANSLLDRLESAVPSSRAQRAPDVPVSKVEITTQTLPDGSGVPVSVTATTGSGEYRTRITFQPKQGFHCTCPDLQKRRAACKHVAALAVICRKRFWAISELIETDVNTFTERLVALESAAERLSSESLRSLGSSLTALRT